MSSIEPIKVPKWGLSMEEGTIVEWHVSEGDSLSEGDELVDIETTKITNVCEAHKGGVLRRIVADPGRTLPVGALIAVMADEGVSDTDIDAFIAEFEDAFDPDEAAAEEAGLEIRSVEIEGGRSVRVGIAGAGQEGTPYVLLHGFGGDLENWSLVQEALSANTPVYTIELPGHGQSTKAVGEGRLSDLADAVVATIEALGLENFIIVGHSLGGAVASEVAARVGDQAEGLGLVCPAAMPGGDLSANYLDAFVAAKRARDLREPVEMLFKDPAMATRDMLDGLAKMKRLDGAQEALSMIKENLKGADPAYAALGARLETVSAPILLLATKADRIVGAPDADQLPSNTTVVWIEDAGHMPHLERSADVVTALTELR
ncbi:MAG: acetoin dehydrogenase dihydrolipoyllysine-residue acetyltransferase subunit [Pseudomonadota bacterium]